MDKKYTFVLDVDGVLTDGSFLYDANGKAYKRFGADDADALKLISDQINVVFVSADHRGFPISKKRVEDMGFKIENVKSKDRLHFIQEHYGLENTIYMGDSFEDIPIFQNVKCSICPANSLDNLKKVASYVTSHVGGDRAVADAVLWLINTSPYVQIPDVEGDNFLEKIMRSHGYYDFK